MTSRSIQYLRKNAKFITVFMGIVCMITFVVGSALIDLANNTRRGALEHSPVVVTWTKGKVNRDELAMMQYRHRVAFQFLANVIMTAVERGGQPIINGRPVNLNQQQQFDVGIPQDDSPESVVQTMVLAEEARRMNVAVDQAAVKQYLRQISSPELKEGDWLEIAQKLVEHDKQLTVNQLMEHLAYELRAQHVRMLAMSGLYAQGVGPIVPPGDAFDLFNRLNRRLSIEAYPVDVAPLITQVSGEPSAAEIEKIFEKGQYRDPDPNIDEPGFHKPHKLAFTSLKVSFAPFLEEAKKQITDAQIEEAYQKDISQGLHKVQELPSTVPPGKDEPGEKKDGEKADGNKANADKPAADKPASDKPGEEKPASDKPAEDKPVEKATDKTEGAKPEGDKGGCLADDEPAAKSDAKAEQPAVEKKEGDKPGAADKPAEAPATNPTDDKPAETKAGDTKPVDAKTEATEPAKEPKFKPLTEVRDQVLTRLAQPIAEEARKKAVAEVVGAIEKYGKSYRRSLNAPKKSEAAAKIQKLDLAPLAVKYNFPILETPLVDQFEVAKYEIGQKVQQFDMAAAQMGRLRMLSFADLAFGQDQPLYKPEEARSSDPDTQYIYFRTAEEKPAELTIKEARPLIVEFWKKQKAFELALADAQKLADKAKATPSLGEAVPDATKLVAAPPFAWMTAGGFGMGFGQPELSPVPGIDLPGQDFMKAVFALQPGETGVAPNQAHSKVYVVRILSQTPDDERLRSQFLESGYNQMVLMLAQGEALLTSVEWYRGVAEEYHVKWLRPPDERRGM